MLWNSRFLTAMMIKCSGIWTSLHTGRNVSAVWRNILPSSFTLKIEAAGSTRQCDFTAKNAFITVITLTLICCNRKGNFRTGNYLSITTNNCIRTWILHLCPFKYNDRQYNQHKPLSPNEAWTVTGSVCAFTLVW